MIRYKQVEYRQTPLVVYEDKVYAFSSQEMNMSKILLNYMSRMTITPNETSGVIGSLKKKSREAIKHGVRGDGLVKILKKDSKEINDKEFQCIMSNN